ncbi:MAG TPA: NAD(P)H:quinone oxidoreductase [Polyangium sp.]|nr:NAD(P)H:quinone oxidoreductase [Polyangium sp.]
MTKVAVIYYSSTGTNYTMAQAVAEGAREAGADVRVRIVRETDPEEVVNAQPHWRDFAEKVKDEPRATPDDVEWADAIVFGTPTRFGNVSCQLKAFIDSLVGLWFQGKLADKVYAGFTSAKNPNGGQEATLLSLYTSVYHFGGIVVTPGYGDPVVFAAGGNPYGPSVTTIGPPTENDLGHAKFLGRRVTQFAGKIRA